MHLSVKEFELLHVENLFDEIWKLVNLVSYIDRQGGAPE